jgi:putative endonuclease
MPAAFVYMLRCGDGSLYTGIAKDLERRVALHQAGKGAKYTRAHLPVELVWSRNVRSWALAMREEARIKRLPRKKKLQLLDVKAKA